MLPDRNILKTAKTILKIQDRLHPLLFGEDGYMLGETRQELLKKANFYIAKVLRTIRDVEVSDIILSAHRQVIFIRLLLILTSKSFSI